MSNPAPRPALRRAPDADVHPAIGRAASPAIDLRDQPTMEPRPSVSVDLSDLDLASLEALLAEPVRSSVSELANIHTAAKKGKREAKAAKTKLKKQLTSTAKVKVKVKGELKGEGEANVKGDVKVKVKGETLKAARPAKPLSAKSKAKGVGNPKTTHKIGDAKATSSKESTGKNAKSRAARRAKRRVELRAQIPAAVLTHLRTAPKANGTSVENVVGSVMSGWTHV